MKALTLSKLQPIRSQSQVDKIENSLQAYFHSENFQPGDSIPKETELAQALGVSRTAIREALVRFKTMGIIEARKNRGMVITHPDILNNMQKVLDLKLLDTGTMKDIFELRLVLEIGIADLLFMRKTDEDLRRLEEIVIRDEEATTKLQSTRYDVEFHSTLYEISGNHTIQRFQKMLLSIFDYLSHELYTIDPTKDPSYVSHRGLLNTLYNGSPEEFRNKMRRHLLQYFNQL